MSELDGAGGDAGGGWSLPGTDPSGASSDGPVASGLTPPPFLPPPLSTPPNGAGRPSTSKVLVITLLVVVAALVVLAGLAILAVSSLSDPESESYSPPTGESLPGRVVDPEAPPEIIAPPEDADMALMSIAELITFVFTPNPDPVAWEARFSDPTGLRAQIEPFVGTLCAVGVETRIVKVEFLGPDRARVEFVFVGPNIPEIGRTFAFFGHVRRDPGGAWIAEPDIVEHVAGLASGFCLQEQVTPREGIEDEIDGTGTHDPGELVDPLHP